jgi:hypothetical protein
MAKWYVELQYGIYNGQLISRAEYYMLRKAGIQFEIVGE